ncbi:MAG: hypothetical protein HP492_04125 [Nitrospira sp.]|nr:hypothetical protein [Nitrospira sp.]
MLNYPPACHLAILSASGRDQKEVESAAIEWKSCLEGSLEGSASITLLGPVTAMGRLPKGHYRHQILVKGTDCPLLCRLIQGSVERMEGTYRRGQVKFVVDIDPVEMG